MFNKTFFAALLMGSLHLAGHAAPAANSPLAQVEALFAWERSASWDSTLLRKQGMLAAYQSLRPWVQSSKSRLQELSEAELRALFKLMDLLGWSVGGNEYADLMQALVGEFEARGATDLKQLEETLAINLVVLRRFDEVRALHQRKPHLAIEFLPPVLDESRALASGFRIYQPDAKTQSLRLVDVLSSPELRVYVVGTIACGFSRRASDAIEAHPELKARMANSSLWFDSAVGRLYFKDVLSWNASHPATRLNYVVSEDDWPFIDSWATPTFYFVKNGRLVEKVQGWPDNKTGVERLLKAFAAAEAAAG